MISESHLGRARGAFAPPPFEILRYMYLAIVCATCQLAPYNCVSHLMHILIV